jgi:Protein of unknown function (DUF3800)
VWFAYVDESYDEEFHWVLALLIGHESVNHGHRALRDAMLEVEDSFPTIDSDRVELHGYDIFHGEGAYSGLEPRVRVWIYDKAITALAASDYHVILRGVNKPGLRRRYDDFAHPHRVCMAHLIERIDEFCAERGSHALVVADEHSETQTALLSDLRVFQERGTWGYRARRVERVIDTIHFVPSDTNRLIQGADLAAFISRRFLSHEETDAQNKAAVLRLWLPIHQRTFHQWCWHP